VYVTHDQEEAFTIADRLILLHEGKIAQEGAPAAVYANPVDGWVASFLGAGNVLEGKMLEGGFAETIFGKIKMPPAWRQVKNARVTLLIRPEDVNMGGDSSPLSGRVDDIRFMQNRYRVILEGGFYFYLSNPPQVGDEVFFEFENIVFLEK
jgi:ABC-type Fe3+/spermidine/putrescine transport system ATPase subunit